MNPETRPVQLVTLHNYDIGKSFIREMWLIDCSFMCERLPTVQINNHRDIVWCIHLSLIAHKQSGENKVLLF